MNVPVEDCPVSMGHTIRSYLAHLGTWPAPQDAEVIDAVIVTTQLGREPHPIARSVPAGSICESFDVPVTKYRQTLQRLPKFGGTAETPLRID